MVSISNDEVLICPYCGENYLHQIKVSSVFRKYEDGAGLAAISDQSGVQIKEHGPEQIEGRRDAVEIEFLCEQCDEITPNPKLIISQHKGQSLVYWKPIP